MLPPAFICAAWLRRAVPAALLLLAMAAAVFYVLQNHYGLVGGRIAFSKLIWLAYTILFWLILPAFIVADRRTPSRLRSVFLFLLVMMAVRGFVELWMIWLFLNWNTLEGAGHDFVTFVGMFLLGTLAYRAGEHRSGALGGWLAIHACVTAAMLLCEICFARYLASHYETWGGQATYFVPDEEQHRVVLAVTTAINTLLSVHLWFFLRCWIHGKTAGRLRQAMTP